jgi:hypothetical protein
MLDGKRRNRTEKEGKTIMLEEPLKQLGEIMTQLNDYMKTEEVTFVEHQKEQEKASTRLCEIRDNKKIPFN